jgi:putative signal transducing protein
MVRFYDPKDENDLARVEELLRRNGVEYFLAPVNGRWPVEIRVAEEDVPQAEALLQKAAGN